MPTGGGWPPPSAKSPSPALWKPALPPATAGAAASELPLGSTSSAEPDSLLPAQNLLPIGCIQWSPQGVALRGGGERVISPPSPLDASCILKVGSSVDTSVPGLGPR